MPMRHLPENLRSLTDAQWCRLLEASVTQPMIDGFEFPGFPPADVQEQWGMQSGVEALREAYSFYVFFKAQMQSLGNPLRRQSRLLDFGCGWGLFLRFFWRDVDDGNLFGCDTSTMMVELCERLGVPGHLAAVESRGRLPYPDAFFDGVLCYSIFTHLPEAGHRHWVRELTRVCRPNAVVCLTLESRRFFDTIAGLSPDVVDPRLAQVRKLKPILPRYRAEYETRGFTYLPPIEGGEDVYGDAICSAGFVARAWGDTFDLKTYIDHASQMRQAVVCLQRIPAISLPPDDRIDKEASDIRRSGLFDPVYYTAMYPDLQPSLEDPIRHYCERGWRDGRNPSDEFDTSAYRNAYGDVLEADINPFWHYVMRGRAEGRLAVADATVGPEDDVHFGLPQADVQLVAYFENPAQRDLRRRDGADREAAEPLQPHPAVAFHSVTTPGMLAKQAEMCRSHGIAAWCFPINAAAAPDAGNPLNIFLADRAVRIGLVLDVDLRAGRVDDRVRDLIARSLDDGRCLRIGVRPVVVLSLPDADDACRTALEAAESLLRSSPAPYRIARRDGLTHCPRGAGIDAVLDFPHSAVPWETGDVALQTRDGVDVFPYCVVVSRAIARMATSPDDGLPRFRAVTAGRDESPVGRPRPLRYSRSTVKEYRRWLDAAVTDSRAHQPHGSRMVFLNAWNDWDRGAVLEPDRRSGYRRLNETSRALLGAQVGLASPRVSVIVVCSGHAPHLRRRLDSIYCQHYGNMEVLVLVAGGESEHRSMCAEYARRFPNITTRMLEADSAGGLPRQWARGIEAASGDLVWLAGDDGFCERNFLETLIRCFDDEAVMLASSKVEFVGSDDTVVPDMFCTRVHGLACRDKWLRPYVNTAHREVAEALGIVKTIPCASGAVFRRPVTMPLLRDEDWLSMQFAGDWILFLHVMRGGKMAYSTDTCAYVRMRADDERLARRSPESSVRELVQVARAVESLYDTPPSTIEAFREHSLAEQGLDGGASLAAFRALCRSEEARRERRLRSPNIAVALMGFYPGGAEIQPIRIANELKRQGHSVILLSAGFGIREPRVRRLVRGDLPVVETKVVARTRQMLHDFGIEVLNSHAWIVQNYPSLVPDVFAGLSAHVATLHGMIEHGNENTVSPANLRRADEYVSTWVHTADKNLVPFIENGLYDAASPRFTKLPNGMEPPHIEPIRRADIGLPDDAFVLCCVSRAIPDKGWAESIAAVARARTMTGRDVRLVLVGKGQLHDEYVRSGVPDFVSLAGFHEHAVNFYAAADMGIMLTKFKSESFPLTIIESLFAGRPFIATDVGEIRSMLSTAGGLAGEVIALDDWQVPIDLAAEAIARHVLQPDLVRASRKRAVEAAAKYRIDRVVAAYVELFKRDVETSPRRQVMPIIPVPSGDSWIAGVESVCGTTIDAIVDQYCNQRPGWVTGDIGRPDARFLMREALESRATLLLEIGTASGMSAGLLCLALESARQAGLVGSEYRVFSYDLMARFYANTSHRVGDAARELLDDRMISHVIFRNPATALDAAREHAADSVRFLFIDASHLHPWPALDLLATLPILAPGATVVLHDVNLPLVSPQYNQWGPHHLFNGLSLQKRMAAEGYRPGAQPNVGSVVIPKDKDGLREEILAIVAAHRWETEIPRTVLAKLGVPPP